MPGVSGGPCLPICALHIPDFNAQTAPESGPAAAGPDAGVNSGLHVPTAIGQITGQAIQGSLPWCVRMYYAFGPHKPGR